MSKENQFIYSHKNSFSAGELTPLMDGRTDLGIYQNGVKKLINFFCLPSGGVMRRHGTEYVDVLNDGKKDEIVDKKLRQEVMLPFVINRDVSFLVVFEIYEDCVECIAF